jgi:hypothetical protein
MIELTDVLTASRSLCMLLLRVCIFLSSSQHRSLSPLRVDKSGRPSSSDLLRYSPLVIFLRAQAQLELHSKLLNSKIDPALIQPTPPPPINSYSKSSQSIQCSQYEKRSCREQRKLQSASEREQKAITCLLEPGTTIDCRVRWWCA